MKSSDDSISISDDEYKFDISEKENYENRAEKNRTSFRKKDGIFPNYLAYLKTKK